MKKPRAGSRVEPAGFEISFGGKPSYTFRSVTRFASRPNTDILFSVIALRGNALTQSRSTY
jgi:hypothetical protein